MKDMVWPGAPWPWSVARRIAVAPALLAFLVTLPMLALGDTPQELIERYRAQARKGDGLFQDFSAERGRAFYYQKHVLMVVGESNCASCHLPDPRLRSRAHRTPILCRACHVLNDAEHPDPETAKKRYLEPFAPSANLERFRDFTKIESFFLRNCTMLLKRECTPIEKGDVIAWLLTLPAPIGEPEIGERGNLGEPQ